MANRTAAIECPTCSYAYSKADEAQAGSMGYRRKRRCLKCNNQFVTYELVAADVKLLYDLKRWLKATQPGMQSVGDGTAQPATPDDETKGSDTAQCHPNVPSAQSQRDHLDPG